MTRFKFLAGLLGVAAVSKAQVQGDFSHPAQKGAGSADLCNSFDCKLSSQDEGFRTLRPIPLVKTYTPENGPEHKDGTCPVCGGTEVAKDHSITIASAEPPMQLVDCSHCHSAFWRKAK
jgi:hypothetical protein